MRARNAALVGLSGAGGALLASGQLPLGLACLALAAFFALRAAPAIVEAPATIAAPPPPLEADAEPAKLASAMPILDGLSDAVLTLDPESRITGMNAAARELLGIDEATVGRTVMEALRIAPLGELATRARQLDAGALSAEFDARERKLVARATKIARSPHVVLVLHDVTEIRRLESMRRDFVANVSHELRTPVSIIRANAETLLDGALEDKARAREFVDAMLRHADRLARLISDLLDLSRIEAGRFPIKPAPVAAEIALRRSIELVERSAEAKGLALRLVVDEPITFSADPRALDQVLANLLDNAVKYTPAGGHVELRARRADGKVRVEVADDGPGIEARHRERVFERFYRVDPGRSRDVGGTGLGLSIVKHLVEVMGGEVGVEPNAPQGSVFWFTLALAGER